MSPLLALGVEVLMKVPLLKGKCLFVWDKLNKWMNDMGGWKEWKWKNFMYPP